MSDYKKTVERLFIGGSLDGQRRPCDGIEVCIPIIPATDHRFITDDATPQAVRYEVERYHYVSMCGTAVMAEENLLVSEIMSMLLEGYKPKGKRSE